MVKEISVYIPDEGLKYFQSTEEATEYLMQFNTPVEDQLEYTRKELETKGYISRNSCLVRYYTRLAGVITKLKNEGYDIVGNYGDKKIDYIYTLKGEKK